jgi:hypothetical protein
VSNTLERPEPPRDGVHARAVVIAVMIVAFIVVLVALISNVLLRGNGPARSGPTETSQSRAILLSSDPGDEIEAYRREKDSQLQNYGWVDREQGIARIPVDRAMKMLVAPEAKP